MKLKSISIQGFKSFADRISLHYHEGITGVIGPNGSGKSNIIDAVRWVMGEQTAKSLRADESTDIIFAGSQNRKPLSMAEVVLTFTNTGENCPPEYLAYSEISIGRRIYRSGEREYFINKQQCRLKDIVDFLLAVGLGAKSYSIIQQEKRDRIIQAKPEEMREILEEAASISVFKQRRKESEARMESTLQQLKNMAEIEYELQNQSQHLSEQVQKAKLKIALVQEHKKNSLELISNHIGYYRGIRNRLKQELTNSAQKVESSVLQTVQWETQANELKIQQIEAEANVRRLTEESHEKRSTLARYLERLQNQKNRLQERVNTKANLNKELQEEQQSLQQNEESLSRYYHELEQADQELRKLDEKIFLVDEQLEEIEEALSVERLRSDEFKSEINATEKLQTTLRTKNQQLLETIQRLHQNLQQTEHQFKETHQDQQQLVADVQSFEKQLHALSQGAENLVQQQQQYQNQITELDTELQGITIERDNFKNRHLETTTHLAALQKLESNLEGFSEGQKTLKENLSSKLIGFLYEKVILHTDDELVLERSTTQLLQAALLQDTETLLDVIDRLEELDSSRVSLIIPQLLAPLNTEELEYSKQLESMSGVRCVGKRLKSSSMQQLTWLFERIFIVRDDWTLIKVWREFGNKTQFIFVSERGTVVHGHQEISFGQSQGDQGQGILRRQREMLELTKSSEELQSMLAQWEGRVYQTQQRRVQIQNQLNEVNESLSKEKFENLKLKGDLDKVHLNLKFYKDQTDRAQNEIQKIRSEVELLKEQFSFNQSELDKQEKEKQKVIFEHLQVQEQLDEKQEHKTTLKNQKDALKMEHVKVTERQKLHRTHCEELTVQIDRIRQKVDRNILQLQQLQDLMTQADSEEQSLEIEVETLQKHLAEFEQVLNQALNAEAQLDENLRVVSNKLKSEKETNDSQQRFIQEKKLELAKCDLILETAEKDIQDQFGLTPNQVAEITSETQISREELEKRNKKLQEEIQSLGAVNELAVQEYESVEERRRFLQEQKLDCETSLQNLRNLIHEIENTTRQRFYEIYQSVNREFQEIFPVLFPGGSAELSLLNPDDLLTTGVEILARLPGKKMQNMNLFSGGEKALTAISLIFALLKTKPAPFCFLDEVDAPLDEANVGRFNTLLDTLCHQFQFVVITHNRRTMEILDTIYGISMGEPGVSKLVSVDLSLLPEHLQKKRSAIISKPEPNLRPGATAQ